MPHNAKAQDTDILFQKMGNRWYLFTQIGDDFIYSALPFGIDPTATKFELYEVLEEHVDKVNEVLEAA
ncbi:MAG: hypothetical protein DRQ88_09415 [Epsilonproteobacteria bacterium]|nr:MAG: hypothetical protein DRQ89_10135 [Campylobacterota bacterium]RLA65338.1 MAG: hypothetical protein DRQ88_09415 [Campylobacterota bacterium]